MGSFGFRANSRTISESLGNFFRDVGINNGRVNVSTFISSCLSSLLACNDTINRVVTSSGKFCTLCGNRLTALRIGHTRGNFSVRFCGNDRGVTHRSLVLFATLGPGPKRVANADLLDKLPFVTSVLLAICGAVNRG